MLCYAKSLESCPTLCDPIDGSPAGSPVPGILQARTLEWAAISFSNAWKWKVKVKSLSRVQLLATPWTAAYQAPPCMGFSRQEYWSGVPLPSPISTWKPFHFTINSAHIPPSELFLYTHLSVGADKLVLLPSVVPDSYSHTINGFIFLKSLLLADILKLAKVSATCNLDACWQHCKSNRHSL